MRSVFDVERSELAALLSPSYRATQVYKAVYQRWANSFDEMTDLAKAERPQFAADWQIELPTIHRRFDSNDGTRRYLVALDDGEFAEAVFIPEAHRNTICISSQIGCALACTFCLTGQLGLKRHLSAGEIVGQVLVAQRDNLAWENRDQFNIVLMGMGEP
jgi:23S rRNA (adenine2503-C2)-methyltransferase